MAATGIDSLGTLRTFASSSALRKVFHSSSGAHLHGISRNSTPRNANSNVYNTCGMSVIHLPSRFKSTTYFLSYFSHLYLVTLIKIRMISTNLQLFSSKYSPNPRNPSILRKQFKFNEFKIIVFRL